MRKYSITFTVRQTVDSLVDADIFLVKLEEAVPPGSYMSAQIEKHDKGSSGPVASFYKKSNVTIDQLFKDNLKKSDEN